MSIFSRRILSERWGPEMRVNGRVVFFCCCCCCTAAAAAAAAGPAPTPTARVPFAVLRQTALRPMAGCLNWVPGRRHRRRRHRWPSTRRGRRASTAAPHTRSLRLLRAISGERCSRGLPCAARARTKKPPPSLKSVGATVPIISSEPLAEHILLSCGIELQGAYPHVTSPDNPVAKAAVVFGNT
jgi:hypothetical protein